MISRITIFYATLGTGHKAAAEALRDWILKEHPQIEVLCRNVLDYIPSWMSYIIAQCYLIMARNAPDVWGKLYRDTDRVYKRQSLWGFIHETICKLYLRKLLKELHDFDPQLILATHFFGMAPLSLSKENHLPLFYVNTDFLSHTLQRCPSFSGWYVGGEPSVRQYQADGLASGVRCFGIPVAPVYACLPSREESRKQLELDCERPIVLLLGGGIGAGALERIADSFLDYPQIQVVIICGNHHRLRDKLRDKYYPFRQIRVEGFVNCMPQYYRSCDLAVSKAGGLSLAEALSAGVPLLLMDSLPGQEQYNSDYLLENGAAFRLYENRRAGEYVTEILSDGEKLECVKRKAMALGRPFAGRDITQDVIGRVNEGVLEELIEEERRRQPQTVETLQWDKL